MPGQGGVSVAIPETRVSELALAPNLKSRCKHSIQKQI